MGKNTIMAAQAFKLPDSGDHPDLKRTGWFNANKYEAEYKATSPSKVRNKTMANKM
jgi:hypothetical protein